MRDVKFEFLITLWLLKLLILYQKIISTQKLKLLDETPRYVLYYSLNIPILETHCFFLNFWFSILEWTYFSWKISWTMKLLSWILVIWLCPHNCLPFRFTIWFNAGGSWIVLVILVCSETMCMLHIWTFFGFALACILYIQGCTLWNAYLRCQIFMLQKK
jgi:hypothetical protein